MLDNYGWFGKNSGSKARPVGLKTANAFGLFDMHGNVWEWCHDAFSAGYYAQFQSADPFGPSSGSSRVSRGGHWQYSAASCRSAGRNYGTRALRTNSHGFRVLRMQDAPQPVPDQRTPRELAEWAIKLGGSVVVAGRSTNVTLLADLPAEPKILEFNFTRLKTFDDKALAMLAAAPEPVGIYLVEVPVTGDGFAPFAGRQFRNITLSQCPLSSAGLKQIAGVRVLPTLYADGCGVHDANLEPFAAHDELSKLSLADNPITDAGLAHIGRMSGLTNLKLDRDPITDAGLAQLKGLTKLTTLKLVGTGITDAGLAHLADLKSLVDLNLGKTKVTAAGVAKLQAALPSSKIEWNGAPEPQPVPLAAAGANQVDPDRRAAQWAIAGGNKVTIRPAGQSKMIDVESSDQLPAGRFVLAHINPILYRTRDSATDAGLENLRGLVALESVYLHGNEIGDTGMALLATVKSLRAIRISLAGPKLTDAGVAPLAALPALQDLTFWKKPGQEPAKITDAAVEALRGLPLTTLRLEGTSVTERAADLIAQAWPGLVEVGLPPEALSDAACRTLAKMPSLKGLHLWGAEVDGPFLRRLAALQGRPDFALYLQYSSVKDADLAELAPLKDNLSSLTLYSTGIGDAGVPHLAQLTKLHRLSLNGTKITDAALEHVAKLPDLHFVQLAVTKVTAAGVAKLQAALPNCKIEWNAPTKTLLPPGEGGRRPDEGAPAPQPAPVPPAAANQVDPDRRAAQWAIAAKGKVTILPEGATEKIVVVAADLLPKGRFAVLNIEAVGGAKIDDAGLANLAGLAQIEALNINTTGVSNAGLSHVVALASLKRLNLVAGERTTIDEAGIKQLASLTGLKELLLHSGAKGTRTFPFTDQGLTAFEKLNPEWLALDGTQVTEQGMLWALRQWPNLKFVGASPQALTPRVIEALTKLPRFSTLNLFTHLTPTTLASLSPLGKLPALHLDLGYSDLDDTTLASLPPLPNVAQILMHSTSVTDAGLTQLVRFPKLRHVSLSRDNITDAGLVHLAQISNLKIVDLAGTAVTAAGVAKLQAALPNCKIEWDGPAKAEGGADADRAAAEWAIGKGGKVAIEVGGQALGYISTLESLPAGLFKVTNIIIETPGAVGDADLPRLLALRSLTELSWNGKMVTPVGIGQLRGHPALTRLTISNLNPLDDARLDALLTFANLNFIGLHSTKPSADQLARLKALPNLVMLRVSWDAEPGVTDLAFARIAELQNLESIIVDHSSITDAGLEHLSALKKLKRLDARNTKVTAAGVAKLQQALPNCKIYWDDPAQPKTPQPVGATPPDEAKP